MKPGSIEIEPIIAAEIYAPIPAESPKRSNINLSDTKYSITLIIMITESRVGNILTNCFNPFLTPFMVLDLSIKKEMIVAITVKIIIGVIFSFKIIIANIR